MKEERRRQKQMESNLEEEYFEDHGGRQRITDSSYYVAVPASPVLRT